ncbi:MAG: helix-turn-helix domain-containing protein [Bacteroidetes bacterium]|nr:helix-turn-helix domain-containing protein [Bacteroidota bacterium]
MELGGIIRFNRKEKNMTQELLASGICSVSYLSKVENGKLEPSEEILLLLLKRLDIEKDVIFSSQDNLIIEELFLWYYNIRDQKYKEATQQKDILFAKQHYFVSEKINIYFKTFSAYYYLKENNTIDVSKLIKELLKKIEYSSNNQKYYIKKVQGLYLTKQKKVQEAVNIFEIVIELGKIVGIIESDVLYNLSILYSRTGRLLRSTDYAKEAYYLYQKNFDITRSMDCMVILGINYLLLKEYHLAEEYFEKILYSRDLSKERRILVLHNLGVLNHKQGLFEKAISYFHESLLVKNDGNQSLKTYYLLADAHFHLQDTQKCNYYIRKGTNLAEKSKNIEYEYKFKMKVNELIEKKSDFKWIEFIRKDVLPYFEKHGDRDDYIEVMTVLGDAYYNTNLYKKAADIYLKINVLHST